VAKTAASLCLVINSFSSVIVAAGCIIRTCLITELTGVFS
jgi:hypothetical protein